MKKSVLMTIAGLLFFISGNFNVNAQPPQRATPEERAKQQTEWMKTSLKLSDDQVTKVDAVNLKYAKKMNDMFQQSGQNADREARQKMRDDLDTQKRVELQAILTADQLKQYDTELAQRRANRGGPQH